MATMNISVPATMKGWIENQSQLGSHANSSDYIRDLVRKDQEQRGALRKITIDIWGSKFMIIGNFGNVAMIRDVQARGGIPTNQLEADTKYVLFGETTPEDDRVIQHASGQGVPCISLNHYLSQIPDTLELLNTNK